MESQFESNSMMEFVWKIPPKFGWPKLYIVTIVKIIDIKAFFSLEISRIKIAPKYIATAVGKCVYRHCLVIIGRYFLSCHETTG